MIFRLLVKPFGSIWNLKELCNTKDSGFFTKIHRFIYNSYQFEHGSAVSYKASFSGIPNLPYGTKQIIISEDVKIGKNCVIFQQVTIQNDTLPNSASFGSPIIGDNCYIYPGAKIIGNVVIGDNVQIGPNAVVTQNIPSNSLITHGEQKIIKMREEITNKYYSLNNNQWVYFDNNTSLPVKDEKIIQKLQKKFQQ